MINSKNNVINQDGQLKTIVETEHELDCNAKDFKQKDRENAEKTLINEMEQSRAEVGELRNPCSMDSPRTR